MTTTTELLWSERGAISCREHAPQEGTDTWVWGRWRPLTLAETTEFEHEVGRQPACETCASRARTAWRRGLREGDRVLYRGEPWHVLGIDPDPAANVWLSREANPDQDASDPRADLDPLPNAGGGR